MVIQARVHLHKARFIFFVFNEHHHPVVGFRIGTHAEGIECALLAQRHVIGPEVYGMVGQVVGLVNKRVVLDVTDNIQF